MHYSLCDYLLDIVQNSVEAGASNIEVEYQEQGAEIIFRIVDDGCGMDDDELKRALDPFYSDGKKHKARKVGLGLPFLEQMIDLIDGVLAIDSEKGKGTELALIFPKEHIDAPPIGDLVSLWTQAFIFDGDYEFTMRRTVGPARNEFRDEYQLSRLELREVLGSFEYADNISLLKQFISSQEEGLIRGE